MIREIPTDDSRHLTLDVNGKIYFFSHKRVTMHVLNDMGGNQMDLAYYEFFRSLAKGNLRINAKRMRALLQFDNDMMSKKLNEKNNE